MFLESDGDIFVHPFFLQFNVLFDVVDFHFQGYLVLRRVGVHVFHQADELHEGRFRFFGFCYEQSVKRVERVKQKVRIDLCLVEGKFRLVFFVFYGLSGDNLP